MLDYFTKIVKCLQLKVWEMADLTVFIIIIIIIDKVGVRQFLVNDGHNDLNCYATILHKLILHFFHKHF